MGSRRRSSRRSSRSGSQRYIGPNSGGRDLRDGVRPQPKPTQRTRRPAQRRRRGSGEAPSPQRRLGRVAPTPISDPPDDVRPDRSHIKYRLVVPTAAQQLLGQADRLDHRDAPGHLAGLMAAEAAAGLVHWRVVPASAADAGTSDTAELDRIVDYPLLAAVEQRPRR